MSLATLLLTLHWLYQLVELLEVSKVLVLLILGVGACECQLVALEFYPALVLLSVFKNDLDLDHFFKQEDNLGLEPSADASIKAKKQKKKVSQYTRLILTRHRLCRSV